MRSCGIPKTATCQELRDHCEIGNTGVDPKRKFV